MKSYLTRIKIVLMLCFLISQIFVASKGYCEGYGYVFSADWQYQVLSTDFQPLFKGDLRSELLQLVKDERLKRIIAKTSIYEIWHDVENHRLFFLIGQGQEDKFYGFIIFKLEPLRYSLKYTYFLEKELTLSESPVDFLMYNKGNRFLVSYWANKTAETYKLTTDSYDANSFKLIQEYSDTLFGISRTSCIINDKELYNGQLFNIDTGVEIKKAGIPLGIYIYDCENNHALGISSKTIREPVTLLLVNLKNDPISKKEIKTNEIITGYTGHNEWYLSKDAKIIIRDEWQKEGKTGRLVFFDIEKDTKKEIKISRKYPYGGGILGFSLSGEFLFYNSTDKLYVINLKDQKIIREIQEPSSPVGIIWP